MSSSWGRLQLLLGWALVLGQLLGGSEEVSPPRFSSEEQLEQLDNSCCQRLNPEIKYRERAARFRKRVNGDAATQPSPVDFDWKKQAIDAMNNRRYYGDDAHYAHLEETFVDVEKAYGVHVTVQLHMKRTNCTREQMGGHQGPLTNSFLEHRGCEPLYGEYERPEECTFQVAWDARSGHHKVIDHRCEYHDVDQEY